MYNDMVFAVGLGRGALIELVRRYSWSRVSSVLGSLSV